MQIPKRFQLLGRTFTVEQQDDFYDHERCFGESRNYEGVIVLQTAKHKKITFDPTMVETTFYHEMVHTILWAMNEHTLNENEQFVDVFAGLLHQILSTAEYE